MHHPTRVVLVALVLAGRAVAGDPPPRVIQYREDKVTIRVEAVPVGEVLDELKRQSGAEIRGQAPKERPVTTEFTAVPVKDALERLLGAQNFTLTYDAKGQLTLIDLKGAPEEKRAVAAPVAAAEPARTPRSASDLAPVGWWDMRKAFDGRAVPISGRLAEGLGSDTATYENLVQMAYGIDDPVTRSDAMRASARALDQDPQLKDALLRGLASMDDAALATYARAACRDRALEFMKRLAREVQTPELKDRARAVLRRVKEQERSGVKLNLEG